jgi:outer membrane protein assembly factor BamD (BamD/ComL family)
MRHRSPFTFAAFLILALPALAQTEYTLDAQGNWVAAPVAPLTADQRVMSDARRLLAENRPGPAISALSRWIDENGTGNSPLVPEAYLLRADAKTANGNEYEALYDYEKVIMDFPATEQYARAVERELEIAGRYVEGLNRRWFGFRIVPAEDVGEELLVRTQERMPGSRVAESAALELADFYYRNRDLAGASDAYEVFVTNFPTSASIDLARERRIYANIGRFKGPDYDASGLAEAKILIDEYAATNPAAARRAGLSDALMARLDESAAAQLLSRARYYLVRHDPVSARYTLQRLVRDHPETVSAARAIAMLRERGWALSASPDAAGPAPAAPAETPPAGVEPSPPAGPPAPAPPEPPSSPAAAPTGDGVHP